MLKCLMFIREVEVNERKHNLFVEVEELLREVQEQLLWWVEARNRAKGFLLWALKSSPRSVVLRLSC